MTRRENREGAQKGQESPQSMMQVWPRGKEREEKDRVEALWTAIWSKAWSIRPSRILNAESAVRGVLNLSGTGFPLALPHKGMQGTCSDKFLAQHLWSFGKEIPCSWHSHCICCKLCSHSSEIILRRIAGDLYAHLSLRSNIRGQELANFLQRATRYIF